MKNLQFYAENCVEERQFTPQSVLRYISELEQRVSYLEKNKEDLIDKLINGETPPENQGILQKIKERNKLNNQKSNYGIN